VEGGVHSSSVFGGHGVDGGGERGVDSPGMFLSVPCCPRSIPSQLLVPVPFPAPLRIIVAIHSLRPDPLRFRVWDRRDQEFQPLVE
jgi:hypothetical protein